ncbi:hypothetical protein SRHO_G00100530 [Serrasalmus rhombeus]
MSMLILFLSSNKLISPVSDVHSVSVRRSWFYVDSLSKQTLFFSFITRKRFTARGKLEETATSPACNVLLIKPESLKFLEAEEALAELKLTASTLFNWCSVLQLFQFPGTLFFCDASRTWKEAEVIQHFIQAAVVSNLKLKHRHSSPFLFENPFLVEREASASSRTTPPTTRSAVQSPETVNSDFSV